MQSLDMPHSDLKNEDNLKNEDDPKNVNDLENLKEYYLTFF